mmetsp:Transcript_36331/g.67140  ORF Transcript_36331/g.67140 Transcript_36331/m.67140 type:complete len:94 (-) Transcript_36331:274-555(-)
MTTSETWISEPIWSYQRARTLLHAKGMGKTKPLASVETMIQELMQMISTRFEEKTLKLEKKGHVDVLIEQPAALVEQLHEASRGSEGDAQRRE